MENILYTFPNCDKCSEVKKYLNKKEIPYEEINAGLGIGKKNFRIFYNENKDLIQRNDGGIILPILFSDSGKILQGIEKIINSPN
jgi:glutaredoxin